MLLPFQTPMPSGTNHGSPGRVGWVFQWGARSTRFYQPLQVLLVCVLKIIKWIRLIASHFSLSRSTRYPDCPPRETCLKPKSRSKSTFLLTRKFESEFRSKRPVSDRISSVWSHDWWSCISHVIGELEQNNHRSQAHLLLSWITWRMLGGQDCLKVVCENLVYF